MHLRYGLRYRRPAARPTVCPVRASPLVQTVTSFRQPVSGRFLACSYVQHGTIEAHRQRQRGLWREDSSFFHLGHLRWSSTYLTPVTTTLIDWSSHAKLTQSFPVPCDGHGPDRKGLLLPKVDDAIAIIPSLEAQPRPEAAA